MAQKTPTADVPPEPRPCLAMVLGALGPYHVARLKALALIAERQKAELVLILRNGRVSEYSWFTGAVDLPFRVHRAYQEAHPEPTAMTSFRQLFQALQRVRPTAIALGLPSPAYFGALLWAALHSTPAILLSESKADDAARRLPVEWIKGLIYRRFHAAVVGGPPHADYAERLGIPRARCFPGYDAVDNDYFTARSLLARANADAIRSERNLPRRYFLAVCRFVPKKNIARLIEAYAIYVTQAGQEAWPLILLGDGPEKRALVELRDSLGLQGGVLFPGLADYQDLPIYYGLAEALIHASTVEQWGLVVNEAMASGLPVLLSRTLGCSPTLLREGENGFGFNPLSTLEIAQCMLRFQELPASRRGAMGGKSQEIVGAWGPERFALAVSQAWSLPPR